MFLWHKKCSAQVGNPVLHVSSKKEIVLAEKLLNLQGL